MSSLPPALAARLAKRGLMGSKAPPQPEPRFEEQEEVIAEDYDDVSKPETSTLPLPFNAKMCDTVLTCPNKYNIYHNCTGFCVMKYADVPEEPSKVLKRKFSRVLKKYPLTSDVWEQVYEPGLKTYYFWNTQTDQVSWLPPSHPDAKISLPAEKLRKLIREDIIESQSDDEKKEDKSDEDDDDDSEEDDDSDSDDSSSSSDSDDFASRSKRRQIPTNRQAIVRRNNLDPMDPAAYSNIPRGKWSDGLRNNDDD